MTEPYVAKGQSMLLAFFLTIHEITRNNTKLTFGVPVRGILSFTGGV